MNRSSSSRRNRAHLSAFSTNQIHLRNPWIVTFFSFSFPGFGNLMQYRYAKAFILIGWELFINYKAKINLGILYSLTGQFEKAKEMLDVRWLPLYCGIYMYTIWDSYRGTVDINKLYLLADREDAPIEPFKISTWDINALDKRKPWAALAWSILAPGLGHLYLHRVLGGFFIFAFTIVIMYFSHIPLGLYYTLVGDFDKVTPSLNMQWTLYLPSIYLFILYDAYTSCVEQNKLFEKEQSQFLRKNYQSGHFVWPI